MRSDEFRKHLAGTTDSDLPVAVLRPNLADALSTSASAVRLSQWNAAKQLYRDPVPLPVDYARVQRMFDDGIVVLERTRHIVAFLEEDDVWWRVVVKSTPNELYLTTYHRSNPRQVQRFRRRHGLTR